MLTSLRVGGMLWAIAPESESDFFLIDATLLGIHLAIRDTP